MDAIQPYRLEMGSRLKTRRGTNLYRYWGDRIAKSLNAAARDIGAETLVNCASQEYFSAVDLKALQLRVVTPEFYEIKNGEPKIVSFFAKKARGAMARFIVENRVTTETGLRRRQSGLSPRDAGCRTRGMNSIPRPCVEWAAERWEWGWSCLPMRRPEYARSSPAFSPAWSGSDRSPRQVFRPRRPPSHGR